jgi:mannose-6-phosphate isomerase-like protein (cupin superfamily)
LRSNRNNKFSCVRHWWQVSLSLASVLVNQCSTHPRRSNASPGGYVLGPTEGDHLIRNAGSIFIKVDPSNGSNSMALGTQQVPIRTGIQVHQHQEADEVLFVLEGTGFGILGDRRIPIETWGAVQVKTSEANSKGRVLQSQSPSSWPSISVRNGNPSAASLTTRCNQHTFTTSDPARIIAESV